MPYLKFLLQFLPLFHSSRITVRLTEKGEVEEKREGQHAKLHAAVCCFMTLAQMVAPIASPDNAPVGEC